MFSLYIYIYIHTHTSPILLVLLPFSTSTCKLLAPTVSLHVRGVDASGQEKTHLEGVHLSQCVVPVSASAQSQVRRLLTTCNARLLSPCFFPFYMAPKPTWHDETTSQPVALGVLLGSSKGSFCSLELISRNHFLELVCGRHHLRS